MPGHYDPSEPALAMLPGMLPVLVVPLGIVLVATATLAARQPETRRHCLEVLAQLTRYASHAQQ